MKKYVFSAENHIVEAIKNVKETLGIKTSAAISLLITEGYHSLSGKIRMKINDDKEAEVEQLRMALDKIANPLKYIQKAQNGSKSQLNGVYAIMLSKDPSYLQDIALSELDKEGKR